MIRITEYCCSRYVHCILIQILSILSRHFEILFPVFSSVCTSFPKNILRIFFLNWRGAEQKLLQKLKLLRSISSFWVSLSPNLSQITTLFSKKRFSNTHTHTHTTLTSSMNQTNWYILSSLHKTRVRFGKSWRRHSRDQDPATRLVSFTLNQQSYQHQNTLTL